MDFYEIFHLFYPKLLFYGTRLVGEDEAEDAIQDVFIEYWKRKIPLTDTEQVKAWLYRALYNRCLNIIKHRKVVDGYAAATRRIDEKRLEYYHPDRPEILSRLENQDLRAAIESAIGELPEKRRAAFVMSYVHRLSSTEIASLMNVSRRTVEAHIYQALRFLRERLAPLLLSLLVFWIPK